MKTIKKQLKRAFTIVELVIVIAVVAALAAILIPTFVNVVNSANESADTSLVKNLNTILTSEEILNGGQASTMKEALARVNDNGYSVDKLTPTSTGDIIWDQEEDQFLLVNGTTVVYPSDATLDTTTLYRYWYIVEKEEDLNTTSYSQYLAYDASGTTVTSTNGASIDVGENTNVTLTVNTSNSQISAGGAVAVSAKRTVAESASLSTPDYRINANGTKTTMVISGNVTLYGTVSGNIVLTSGKLTIAAGASVSAIYVDASKCSDVSITNNSSNVIEVAAATLSVNDLTNGDSSLTSVDITYNTDFAGGFGTSSSPYQIATATQLSEIEVGSGSIKYYQLTADIDLKDSTNYGAKYLVNAYFDGNGHKIYCSSTNSLYGVFGYVYCTATIVNLKYDLSNLNNASWSADLVPLIYDVTEYNRYSGSTSLTVEDVTISGTHSVDSNNGPFIFMEFIVNDSTISFINCEMAADLSGSGYNACFIGWQGDYTDSNNNYLNLAGGSISFTDCTVSGTLSCDYAGMYTANPSNAYKKSYSFSGNSITGTIRGTNRINLFCAYGTDTTCETYTDADASTTYSSFNLFVGATDTTLAVTADADGNLTLTASDSSNVVKYIVYVGIYTNYYDADGNRSGTWLYYATETITVTKGVDITTVLKNIGFVDASYCTANNITTQKDSAGNEYATINGSLYYVIRDYINGQGGQGYVGSPTAGGITTAKNIVRICAYLEDGTLYSSAELK